MFLNSNFGNFWFFTGPITLYSFNFATFHVLIWIPFFFIVLLDIFWYVDAGPLYFCFLYPLYFLHCFFYINFLDMMSDEDKDDMFERKTWWLYENAELILLRSFIQSEWLISIYFFFLILFSLFLFFFTNHLFFLYLITWQYYFLSELHFFYIPYEIDSSIF